MHNGSKGRGRCSVLLRSFAQPSTPRVLSLPLPLPPYPQPPPPLLSCPSVLGIAFVASLNRPSVFDPFMASPQSSHSLRSLFHGLCQWQLFSPPPFFFVLINVFHGLPQLSLGCLTFVQTILKRPFFFDPYFMASLSRSSVFGLLMATLNRPTVFVHCFMISFNSILFILLLLFFFFFFLV